MRKLLVLGAAVALAFSLTASPHHGPAKVVIKAAAKKAAPVPFAHDQHASTLAKPCDTCHHTNKGLTEDTVAKHKVEKCSACHLDPKTPDIPSMREAGLQKNPFHSQCIGCHKKAKKGPTVCKDCHKK
jgi:hypothetical protein